VQNPIHEYTSAGDYTVSLTATNAGGSDTATKTNYISVTSGGPTTVTVYPDSWQSYGGASQPTITSGGLADLRAADDVYMVAACNTSTQQGSMEFTFNTGYSTAEVTQITVDYELHLTRTDTPILLLFIKEGDTSNWTTLLESTWSTTDQRFTWSTTDVARYLGSGGVLTTSVCGCPQNSNNYSDYLDLISIKLDLAQ